MNRIAVSFALMVALLAASAYAQPSPTTPAPAAATCPVATTLDELAKALDDAVSGPRDKDRTCLRELMLPEARLTPVRKQWGRFRSAHPHRGRLDQRGARPGRRAPFYEKQVKVKSETYGHFAHLWSTYEIRPTPDGKPEVIGINSVQAIYDGMRWRVLSVLWEADTTAGPVPEKYLP